VSPTTVTQCLSAGGVALSVPTNSPRFIPSGSDCATPVVMQFFWLLPSGATGAAYNLIPRGPGAFAGFLPTAITGAATTQPIATFYGWFACPTGYGPVAPSTTTPVTYSTGSNYECLSGVPPAGTALN
jgi:hypothetical protein